MKSFIRLLLPVCAVLASLASLAALAALAVPAVCLAEDKIVAVVNNEVVTQKDLDTFLNFMRIQLSNQYAAEALEAKVASMRPDLLQRLVEDRLILQEARKSGLHIDPNRIKGKLNEIKSSYRSEMAFQESLLAQGMTQQDLETRMREQMMIYGFIEKNVKSKIIIKPQEITEFYNANPGQFTVAEQRSFVSLMASDKTLAEEIAKKLSEEGLSLDDAAAAYGLKTNSFTAVKGQELKKEIEEVVFSLEKDRVSPLVPIGQNFYFFKVTGIVGARTLPLAEVQSAIRQILLEKKLQQSVVETIDELKKKSYIKISEG